MAFLRPTFLQTNHNPQSNLIITPSINLLKFCWILVFLKACNAVLIAQAPTFDALPTPQETSEYKDLRELSPGLSLENEETYNNYNTNLDINNINMYRMRRDSTINGPSQYRMNDLSRAFGRLHFGPLLRLRSISNRAPPPSTSPSAKFVTSDPPRRKKALSYLSRFYPMFQSSPSNSSPAQMQTLKSARRRLTATFSGESATFPLGRSHRPNMRLRWGK